MGCLTGLACVGHRLTAREKEAVSAAAEVSVRGAEGSYVLGDNCVTGRGAGERSIARPPGEIDDVAIRCDKYRVVLGGPEVAALEGVAAQRMPHVVRRIAAKALPLECIEMGTKIIGNGGKPADVKGGGSWKECFGQILAGGVDRRIINIAGALGLSPVFVIAEEVPVARGHHQLTGRSPIAAEAEHGKRADPAIIRTEGARIGGYAGIRLARHAVSHAQLPREPRVGIVPAGEQAQRVKGAKVQPVVHIVLDETLGQPARTGIAARESCGPVRGVNQRNIAAEQPQPVTEEWAPNLVAGLDDATVVFLELVVFGRAIQTATGA